MAIFPAGRPQEVIRIPGIYTRTRLIEKLHEAGASKGAKLVGKSTEEELFEPDADPVITVLP